MRLKSSVRWTLDTRPNSSLSSPTEAKKGPHKVRETALLRVTLSMGTPGGPTTHTDGAAGRCFRTPVVSLRRGRRIGDFRPRRPNHLVRGRQRGGQNLVVAFEAEEERYRWLNNVLCVGEGVIDPEKLRAKIRIYTCVNELL